MAGLTSPISYEAESVFSSLTPEEQAANEAADYAREQFEQRRQGLWDPAWAAAQRRTEAAQQYGLEAQQMTTAAQQQLGAGLGQTRADMMAAAGARGLSPALGRAAGYAGGQLQQRGVGQAKALQAQELASAQAQQQQALAAQAGLGMGMSEQLLGQTAAEQQAYQSMQALQAQQAAAAAQQAGQYGAAGIGAAGVFGSMAAGGFGGGQQQGWSPEYQQQYQQWAQTYSDIRLKTDVQPAGAGAEQQLLGALASRQPSPAELAQLEVPSGYERRMLAAAPRQPSPEELQQLEVPSEYEKRMMLASLQGLQYEYKPEAQQQLGQPPGLQFGPMAQDLAKSKLGASAVVPTPQGLGVDTGRLGMITAGLVGQLGDRVKRLEKGGR